MSEWRDEGGHAWERRANVDCVECPHCLFTFAAIHTTGDSDGYSCPNCEGCPEAQPPQPISRPPRRKSRKEQIAEDLSASDLGAQMCERTDIEYGPHDSLPRGEHVARLGNKAR